MELYNATEFPEETLRNFKEVFTGMTGVRPENLNEDTVLSEDQWQRFGKKFCEKYGTYRIRDNRKPTEKNGLTIRECLEMIEVLI